MTTTATELAVVEFELGTFRAAIEEGVVTRATFDATPQPRRHDRFGVSTVLDAYFAGEVAALDSLQVRAHGTPFQQAVWRGLRAIPVGTTISYGELARRVGKPNAQRAVGRYVTTDYFKCVGCHICADVCPSGYIQMGLERITA